MTRIMKECWYESAAARLTAIRVKKNVDILQGKHRKMMQLTKINEANNTANEASGITTNPCSSATKKSNTNNVRPSKIVTLPQQTMHQILPITRKNYMIVKNQIVLTRK